MDTKKGTVLNCYFDECSRFLGALRVNLRDAFQQPSTDDRKPEQKQYIFNEDKLGAIAQSIHNQVNIADIGLLIGKRIRFGFTGLDAIHFHHNLSLKEFLWALSRYLSDFFPQIVIEFFERSSVVGYKLILCPYTTPHQRFYTDVLAAMIYNFLQFLMGDEAQPEYISFNYSQPFPSKNYRAYFNCSLYFGSNQFEFAISRRLADSPIIPSRCNIVPFPQNCSVGYLFPLQLYSLSQQIHQMMDPDNDKAPPEDHVAKKLRISARTLRRKLSQFNSTFQKEIDYFRRDLAFKHLRSQDLDITSVAHVLGFSDSSAFSKAFRKWSGITPREFKKRFCTTKKISSKAGRDDLPQGNGQLPNADKKR